MYLIPIQFHAFTVEATENAIKKKKGAGPECAVAQREDSGLIYTSEGEVNLYAVSRVETGIMTRPLVHMFM